MVVADFLIGKTGPFSIRFFGRSNQTGIGGETAMGYPDWDSSVNNFERKRAGLEEFVTWVS